jgi:penicillin-binding protein 1B
MPRRRPQQAVRGGAPPDRKKKKKRSLPLLRLAVVLLTACAALLLYLQVQLTQRFEGRLWLVPSRVYSDALLLEPGMRIDASRVVSRLDRSGYARTESAPRRSGQYRRSGSNLDVYLRAFESVGHRGPARRMLLRFRSGELRSIEDDGGAPLARAVLEPELLATLFGPRHEERSPVRLDEVPDVLLGAVLAAEDARFFSHHGLDLRGIGRAAAANLRRGRIVQGGSTITQQTVKNLFLGQERTWWRKMREGVMSVLLDARYSKERILEAYFNEVYLGQRGSVAICGLQAAARFYFGRDQHDLSLAESALLAGLIASPGRYNPFRDPAAALERRDQVLQLMVRHGFASEERARAARAEPLSLASGSGGFAEAPYAVDHVQSELQRLFAPKLLAREGLRVYTTIDTSWQAQSERALREGLAGLEARASGKGQRRLQGAVVVIDPRSGEIRALVGGRDYAESQFNRATQSRRQPGSCFKPFVYAAAFEAAAQGGEGLTPASVLDDSPLALVSGGRPWSPENYDGTYRGPVTARTALEQSLNVPTVRAAQEVGLETVVDLAARAGIASPLAAVPSIALGAVEVRPLELAAAYGTLAALGEAHPPRIVRGIVDPEGHVSLPEDARPVRALSAEAAWLVDDVLRGTFVRGTARSAAYLGFRGDAAGKTGTTDGTRDSWFVGYTDELLALVWVGYDDNAVTGFTGASGALPIWVDLMDGAGEGSVEAHFEVPERIVLRRIDPETGGLYTHGCPAWRDEAFIEGSEPERSCPVHGGRLRRWLQRMRGESPVL